jgi:hypothetical protein
MNTLKQSTLLFLVAFMLFSCASVYNSSDSSRISKNHKLLAIMPPKVTIAPRKKIDQIAIMEQQKNESKNFQNEIYTWLLKRKTQGSISQEIQNTEDTNILLAKAGYPEKTLTSEEACKVLGVDAVINSNFALSKPVSEGVAIVTAVLLGVGAPTNEVTVTMNIKDCTENKHIWNYSHKFSGSIGSSASRLVDGLMRNASKKMPYFIK